MAKRYLVMYMFTIVCLAPAGAFADAQTIDFSSIMEYSLNRIAAAMPMPWHDIGLIDWSTQTGLGIPDVEEFALLSQVLADPSAPNHVAIHSAFATNSWLARTAIGSTLIGLTTPNSTDPTVRQPIPGTDPQQYYGMDALWGAYVTMGEWDIYAEAMQEYKHSPFGVLVQVPANSDAYTLLPNLLGMCGDVDGDNASNSREYWALTPFAWTNATNASVADEAYNWSVWACLNDPGVNARFWYNETNQRVYTLSNATMTWQEALDFTLAYPNGVPIPVELCTVRDADENDFIADLLNGYDGWIGCTDAGRDVGHAAPNPDDWYWLSDVTQSAMTYTNWASNQPNGVDGLEDCGLMDGFGEWKDMSEFQGEPAEPRRFAAVFELAGTFTDEDINGAPDLLEDKDGDGLPDGAIQGEEGEGEEGEGEEGEGEEGEGEEGEGEEGEGEEGEGEGDDLPFSCFGM